MMRGIVDVTDEKTEVQRGGKDDEKTEDDFFEIHDKESEGQFSAIKIFRYPHVGFEGMGAMIR